MESQKFCQDPDDDPDSYLYCYESRPVLGIQNAATLLISPGPNSSGQQGPLPTPCITTQFLSELLTTHTSHEISTIIYLQVLISFKFAHKLKKTNVRTSLIRFHKNATRRSFKSQIPKNTRISNSIITEA